ncbi:GAF domain-containing protein [Microbacterium abyssi]|uniref:GAF domain-containing protein n=1 Tax=Microbacterium abyssi TaxID=2782166 RepID=UPI00188937ED|nr:GAF domain-containing protein [Microbacterium sp. A18JL241]
MPEPEVFRAPMRSHDDNVPAGVAVDRALEHGVCGIGGRLGAPPTSLSDAIFQTDATYGERAARRLERFAGASEGSFVWTRNVYDFLWLGRIGDGWSYDADPGAWAVDLVHVRLCDWIPTPIPWDQAPPSVHASLARGGRNWQRIRAADALPGTARVWSRYHPDAPVQLTRAVG